MDLEITIKNQVSAVDHQRLQERLTAIPGVEGVCLWEDKLEVRYDPERITRHRLHEIVVGEGFTIADEESAPPTPSVDSV